MIQLNSVAWNHDALTMTPDENSHCLSLLQKRSYLVTFWVDLILAGCTNLGLRFAGLWKIKDIYIQELEHSLQGLAPMNIPSLVPLANPEVDSAWVSSYLGVIKRWFHFVDQHFSSQWLAGAVTGSFPDIQSCH